MLNRNNITFIIITFAVIMSATCAVSASKNSGISHVILNTQETTSSVQILTDDNFQDVIHSGITVVDFYANWCKPCQNLAPVFAEVAEEMQDVATFAKFNIDQESEIPGNLHVQSIPTLVIFKDGVEVKRRVGGGSKKVIRDFVESAL